LFILFAQNGSPYKKPPSKTQAATPILDEQHQPLWRITKYTKYTSPHQAPQLQNGQRTKNRGKAQEHEVLRSTCFSQGEGSELRNVFHRGRGSKLL